MATNKKLDKTGLSQVWIKVFSLIKELTGDVDTSKGTLQDQILALENDLSTAQNDLSTAQNDLSTVKSDLSTAQNDLSTVQGDLSTAQKDIEELNTNLNNKITSGQYATLGSLELHADIPYIDFHFGNSAEDYTSRVADIGDYLSLTNNKKGILMNGYACIHSTSVETFTDGECWLEPSQLGLPCKPDVMIITPQSGSGLLRYDWDNSSDSAIRLIFHAMETDGTVVEYSGDVRFGMIAFAYVG